MRTDPRVTLAALVAMTGCAAMDNANESSTRQAEITTCPASYPRSASDLFMATPPPMTSIVRDKELIITDLSVVQNSCQASWTAPAGLTCTASTLGKWTFGWLMTAMAGETSITSVKARQFVASWLTTWLFPRTVGQDPTQVAARNKIWDKLLKPWLAASLCNVPVDTTPANPAGDAPARAAAVMACAGAATNGLNLAAAPFRLDAVVNRIDLDGRDYQGNGAPGELRFVFGAVDTTQVALPPLQAAVILEYHLPSQDVGARVRTFQWAQMFHSLATADFATNFTTTLQNITSKVTEPAAWPARPNGSAITHVRTSELDYDGHAPSSRQWEFRQFVLAPCADLNLTGNCLTQDPVSQTPPNADNNSSWLTSFLRTNKAAATVGSHVIPAAHLGGSSLSPNGGGATVWNTEPDLNNDGYHVVVDPADTAGSLAARHGLAFSTCTGCHYLETQIQTQLFHIGTRTPTTSSTLSNFLKLAVSTTDYDHVLDPNLEDSDLNGTALYFDYNEIWRRGCELRRLLSGSSIPYSTATGHH